MRRCSRRRTLLRAESNPPGVAGWLPKWQELNAIAVARSADGGGGGRAVMMVVVVMPVAGGSSSGGGGGYLEHQVVSHTLHSYPLL